MIERLRRLRYAKTVECPVRESIVQHLARRVQMPGTWLSVPIITGAPMFSAASGHREKRQGANTARRASNGPG